MMRVKLTHIGVISLGKLIGISTMILSELVTVLLTIAALLGIFMSKQGMMAGLGGAAITFVVGTVGSIVAGLIGFVYGVFIGLVYNFFLGMGGGLDMDFKER